MSDKIEKKDLLQAKSQFENLLVNSKVNTLCYESAVKRLDEEIAKFPVEEKKDDPMPEDIKEIISEIPK